MVRWIFAAPLLLAFLLLSSCGPAPQGKSGEAGGRLVVVATTSFLADLASSLAQDQAEVTGLMGPGVDPHLYKPTAGDLERIRKADVVLVHGLHLEGRMGEMLEALVREGKRVVVAGDFVPKNQLILSRDAAKKPDPHIWFDPDLWAQVAEGVATALEKKLGKPLPGKHQHLAEIRAAKKELQELADQIPQNKRVLITAHDAFAYFGRAFGFEVHGIQGISTATEAGAQDLRKLADLIASRGVKAIFAETTVSRATIDALQEAVRSRGKEVSVGRALYSDAVGAKGFGQETTLSALRFNMESVVEALK